MLVQQHLRFVDQRLAGAPGPISRPPSAAATRSRPSFRYQGATIVRMREQRKLGACRQNGDRVSHNASASLARDEIRRGQRQEGMRMR